MRTETKVDIGDRLLRELGVRVDCNKQNSFRCDNCNMMQPKLSDMAWIPDGVLDSDPPWSVAEKVKATRWNGTASGWCLSCAAKLITPKIVVKTNRIVALLKEIFS